MIILVLGAVVKMLLVAVLGRVNERRSRCAEEAGHINTVRNYYTAALPHVIGPDSKLRHHSKLDVTSRCWVGAGAGNWRAASCDVTADPSERILRTD